MIIGTVEHLDFLRIQGRKGGKSRSAAKVKAARRNAKKASAARRGPTPCKGYPSHRFSKKTGKCYSAKCRKEYPELRNPNA